MEKAIEFTGNLVIQGELKENLLNHRYHKLQEVLMFNFLKNIINAPTRGRALLDPVIVPDDLTIYDSGKIANSANISDHSATYLTMPPNNSVSCAFSRRIWLYNREDFAELYDLLRLFNWECLRECSMDNYCELFANKFMEFVNSTIPYKGVVGWSGGALGWVHFQCRGVLLIWIREGQGPTLLSVSADGGCMDIFLSSLISLFFLPFSGRRSDID